MPWVARVTGPRRGSPLDRDDVGFYDDRGRFAVENGRIDVYAGNTSAHSGNRQSFRVTGGRRPQPGS